MLRTLFLFLAGLCLTGNVGAATWAEGMFDELSKDFGSVPRGPTLSHPFRLANNTGGPVHVSSVRVSCGCVTATASKSDLQPGEETTIATQMDTRRFTNLKSVTIYVQFDRPQFEEVRLTVQANSRDDVTVAPESFTLGQARRGSTPSGTVIITFLGNGQSQIEEVRSDSNYVQTTLQELRRQPAEVAYQLTAKLRTDAPVGKWYTDIWLKTTNPAMPRVRVPLTVEVQSFLSVSPGIAMFGSVKVGDRAERKVIVRGTAPFRITEVRGTDGQLGARDSTEDSKPVHVLTLTLNPDKEGEFHRVLKVITDLKEQGEIEFHVKGQVAAK